MAIFLKNPIQKIREKFRGIFGIDVRALAAIRVGFALIIIFDLLSRARNLAAHYTDAGVFPRAAAFEYLAGRLRIPFHLLGGSWQFEIFLFGAAGIFALMMLVGYRTRFATVLSWIFLISLQSRNPLLLQGGDFLLRLCLFWGMFLPWGTAYSWDAARRAAKKIGGIPAWISTVGTAGFLVQVALVYFSAFLSKLPWSEWTASGNAIYYSLHISQFETFFGGALLSLGSLFPFLLPALTAGVILLEGCVLFLLFFPIATKFFRTIAVFLVLGLQLGLGLSMNLGPFPWVSAVAIIGFLPVFFWDAIAQFLKSRERPGLTIYYDGECGFCRTAARAFASFFFLQTAAVLPATEKDGVLNDMMEKNSWIAVNAVGARIYKFGVFAEMARHSHVFRVCAPLLRFPPILAIGNFVYEFIAAHRSRKCVPDLPSRQEEISKNITGPRSSQVSLSSPSPRIGSLPAWATIIALLCIAQTLKWGIAGSPANPHWATFETAVLLGINKWNMFERPSQIESGWYETYGYLQSGERADVLQNKKVIPG